MGNLSWSWPHKWLRFSTACLATQRWCLCWMVFNVLILYRTSLSSIQTEFLAGCKWVCKVVAKEIKGALGHQIQDSPLPRVHLVICHVTKHARCYRDHERSLTSKELVACLGRKLQKICPSIHHSFFVLFSGLPACRNLRSSTRNQTCAPCIGSAESYPLGSQASPNLPLIFDHLFNSVLDKTWSRPWNRAVSKTDKNRCPHGAYSITWTIEK